MNQISNKEKVSVVIPLFNKEKHINRSIESVLAQVYRNFELIIVDDGSTDASRDIVKGYEDHRIRLIEQENSGVSVARNRGIKEATSGLVAFLDADDMWKPTFLYTVMELRRIYPEAGMYATAYEIDRAGKRMKPDFDVETESKNSRIMASYFRAAVTTNPVCASAVMIPKEVFKKIDGFPEDLKRGEDLYTWAKIAVEYPVAWSQNVEAVYFQEATNRACNTKWTGQDIAGAEFLCSLLDSDEHDHLDTQSINEYLEIRRLRTIKLCVMQGDRDTARKIMRKTTASGAFHWERLKTRIYLTTPIRVIQWLQTIKRLIFSQLTYFKN